MPKFNKGESFNKRVNNVINVVCYKLHVTNYGENKTSFNFYTPSLQYALTKKKIILKNHPETVINIEEGEIVFK